MAAPGRKRRLPVLSGAGASAGADAGADAGARPRPRWQWLLLGVALIVAAWLPLAALAAAAMRHSVLASLGGADPSGAQRLPAVLDAATRQRLALFWALGSLLSLALAACLGGLALRRWGGAVAARLAGWAGACVACLAVALAAAPIAAASGALGVVATLFISGAVAAASARLGARLGLRLVDRQGARLSSPGRRR